MLTKEEFTQQLLGQIDDLYAAYVAAQSEPSQPGNLFPHDRPLDTPEFQPQGPKYTPEELQAEVDKLAKEAGAERVLLKIGEVTLTIAMIAAKS